MIHNDRFTMYVRLPQGNRLEDIYQSKHRAPRQTCLGALSGDHIRKATPVPFSNTVVKLSEPMIVYTNAKVGIAGLLKTPC